MQLFELFATLSLNSKGFEKALSGAAGGIGSFVKQLGVTQLAIQGIEKGFSEMTKLIGNSVSSFADYEQFVGGVETLFGAGGKTLEEYAKSVGKTAEQAKNEYDSLIRGQELVFDNAEKAYKTAGMSQNEYMDTVTSFSASLLQGLGGDTEEAARVADQAIVDMADNVNKMGSSMESVQNAYKGFAKGNFTMLDNLKLGRKCRCRVA